MTNSGAPQPGATIVQYAAHSSDGTQQFFVPGSQLVVQGIVYCIFLYETFILTRLLVLRSQYCTMRCCCIYVPG